VRRAGPLREKGVGMAECRCGSIQLASTDRRQALCAALCAAGFFSSLPRQAFAEARQMAPLPEDEAFMRMALAEAAKGDFPFGAVIVRESEVLAKGRNLGKTNNDPTAHGEMVAIRNFVAERPAQEFAKTTLYTSGEPCAMCISHYLVRHSSGGFCGIGRGACDKNRADHAGEPHRCECGAICRHRNYGRRPFL
jgi:tRNA(adenine34) deaminase